jgi:hypothetical protein
VVKWYMIPSFELIRSLELLGHFSCRRATPNEGREPDEIVREVARCDLYIIEINRRTLLLASAEPSIIRADLADA